MRKAPFIFSAALLVGVNALVLFNAGCGASAQRKLIIVANEAQDAAARTYEDAKVLEMQASLACRAALESAGNALPTKPEAIRLMCAAIGKPVPYDPVLLKQAAGPINALYEGVRAANAVRKKDPSTFVTLANLFQQVVADLTAAGVALPQKVIDASTTLRKP